MDPLNFSQQPWASHTTEAVEFFLLCDPDGTIQLVNRTHEGINNPIGLNVLDFPAPDYVQPVSDAMKAVLKTGLPHYIETQATGPNGALSYYSNWIHRIEFEGRTLISVTSNDISHLRRIEEKLAISDETLRSLVRNAPDLIIILDTAERITFINQTLTEKEMKEVIGQKFYHFLPEAEWDKARSAFKKVIEKGNHQGYETHTFIPDEHGREQTVYYSTRLGPIYLDGEIKGVTVISTDVSEKKLTEQRMRELESKLFQGQKLQAIGQLAGGIAHDFNNLLSVMLSRVELAKIDISKTSQAIEHLDELRQSVERASSLVQQLLSFGRKQTLNPSVFEPANTLAGLLPMLKRTIGPQVEINLVSRNPIQCYADPAQFESAVVNLVLNSRDAMGNTGGTIQISVAELNVDETCGEDYPELNFGDYVQISVADSGPGIREEDRRHVFEPFFTTKDVGAGSGLGLSMVYGFAQQSGGSVSISGGPEGGAVVHICLPRSEGEEKKKHNEEFNTSLVSDSALGKKIFLVEDAPGFIELIQAMVEKMGYRVIAGAKSGAPALAALQEHPDIDILISDIGLPGGINGVELVQQARALYPKLQCLLITGFDWDGRSAAGLTVLKKPFSYAQLANALAKIQSSG